VGINGPPALIETGDPSIGNVISGVTLTFAVTVVPTVTAETADPPDGQVEGCRRARAYGEVEGLFEAAGVSRGAVPPLREDCCRRVSRVGCTQQVRPGRSGRERGTKPFPSVPMNLSAAAGAPPSLMRTTPGTGGTGETLTVTVTGVPSSTPVTGRPPAVTASDVVDAASTTIRAMLRSGGPVVLLVRTSNPAH